MLRELHFFSGFIGSNTNGTEGLSRKGIANTAQSDGWCSCRFKHFNPSRQTKKAKPTQDYLLRFARRVPVQFLVYISSKLLVKYLGARVVSKASEQRKKKTGVYWAIITQEGRPFPEQLNVAQFMHGSRKSQTWTLSQDRILVFDAPIGHLIRIYSVHSSLSPNHRSPEYMADLVECAYQVGQQATPPETSRRDDGQSLRST